MTEPYIQEILETIRDCSMDNTYKMAWLKAIVDICHEQNDEFISYDSAAKKVFSYYWDQTIFFNLRQGPRIQTPPEIITIVNEKIAEYQSKNGTQPIKFIKVESILDDGSIKKIANVLKKMPGKYFITNGSNPISTYQQVEGGILVKEPNLIKQHADCLYPAIMYRWAQKLEEVDNSPNLIKKLKGIETGNKLRRGNLKKFHQFLDYENNNKICFITKKPISNKVSVDHVIPWSYMFEDKLWNLVYVDSSENSSKSNRLPSEKLIIDLEDRNKKLLNLLKENNIKHKYVDELELAIKNDWVRRFWLGYKN